MHKILPSQLTDQEILDLLEKEDQLWEEDIAQIFNTENDIVPFLGFYKICPGETPVSKKLIYKLYKTYSKEALDELNFNIQLGNYISGNSSNYHINIDTFAISNHIYKAEKTVNKVKNLKYQRHFQWFLENRGVEKGQNWLEGFILFFIYKDFCKERRVFPQLGYVNFHKFLKLHLPYKRIKGNRSLWFRVNEETANLLSKEDRDKITEARQKTRRSQEEKQHKPEETPSS